MRSHSCKIQVLAYHLTPRSNLSAISEHGLLPAIGKNSARAGETVPATYCFVDIDAVETALLNWAGDLVDDGEPIALLGVDLTQMLSESESERGSYEIAIQGPIEPSRITILATDLDEAMFLASMDDLHEFVGMMIDRFDEVLEEQDWDVSRWISHPPLKRWQIANDHFSKQATTERQR